MALKHYHDFVLVADGVVSGEAGLIKSFNVRVFDSPAGQGENVETVEVPGELYEQLRWLEERDLDERDDVQMNMGETLASLMLPEYARRLFSESLTRIGADEGLRLRLRLADELGDFPWEFMYVPSGPGPRTARGFLALDLRVSFARHEALAIPGDWFGAPASRRVVVAMATPEPYSLFRKLLSLPAEQRELRAVLGGVAGIEPFFAPVYVDGDEGAIPGVTLKELMTALMLRTDVFHFSGHGVFDKKRREGRLVLADDKNHAEMLNAEQLAEVLRGRGVRLVVLGACETGRRDGRNVWGSVVAALLRAGIPAVVAMQFKISDPLAAAFSGAFYRALVAGLTVDEAVTAGRLAIRAETPADKPHMRDWGVPVLYLRAPSGAVFNPVDDEQAVASASEGHARLFEQELREVSATGRVVGAALSGLKSGTVEVDQKIQERVSGVVIGAYVVSTEGSRLVIKQKADTVDGTLIGGVLDDAVDERSVAERLRELLDVVAAPSVGGQTPAAAPFCQTCGTQNGAAAKFCKKCGSPLE